MVDKKKVIGAAAGVAAATVAGIAVTGKRRKGRKDAGSGDGGPAYHVVTREDGWAVKGEGAERASSTHSTKREAVQAGRDLARRKAPARLVIHRMDGTVQETRSYEPGD